jgi:hypothetical protein
LDAVCVITAPRAGTAHLGEVLRNVDDLAVFGDLLQPARGAGIAENQLPVLRQATGIDFANLRDPRLTALVAERPGTWLDAIETVTREQGKRLYMFRLMPGQAPLDVIDSEVVPRPGLRIVVAVRRQVDAYVSWRKAVELGRWAGVDTTGMRIMLDSDHFEAWLGAQEHWFEHWRALLARRFLPCPVVRYEIDIDIPAERMLRRFAAAVGLVGITIRSPAHLHRAGLERQDKASSIGDKVTNWTAFSREIFSRGLERRAFGYPI